MIQIFTITARNYLSLALTLGDSVRLHHPEASFTIFVSDGLDDINTSTLKHSIEDARLAIGDDFDSTLPFKYNITEYCTAIKPALFQRLFELSPETEIVYYLDPDTVLFDRLDPIVNAEPSKTLFLAPHLLDCRLADDHPYPEYKHLWEGIFNLGFCAIRRSPMSVTIIDWWNRRLQDYCYADYQDGLHTDQKWMDYAPAFFGDALCICRHYGVNVAHWNLVERQLVLRDEKYLTREQPLIFFHFSGFDFRGQSLTKHVPADLQVYINGSITALAETYRAAVLGNGYDQFINIPYRYASYSDGAPVSQLHRRLFRVCVGKAKENPFNADGAFRRTIDLAGLLDSSPSAIKSHSASTITNLGALNSRAQWVLKLALRVLGPRRYAYLIKFFGRYGRLEAHAFLLESSQ
jgi:hypothetical protein